MKNQKVKTQPLLTSDSLEKKASDYTASHDFWDYQWDMKYVTNDGESYVLYQPSKNISVGIIDSGYRGEIISKFKITTDAIPSVYQPGEKFAQLVIVPIQLDDTEFVDELSETDRDTDGFGSTAIKEEVESEVSNNEIKQ